MRQFAWYSPKLNVIVLQSIMDDCYIAFEWDHFDLYKIGKKYGYEIEPMEITTWVPLGEL